MKEKEAMRQEMSQTHKAELESRDYLTQLLQEKVESLQKQVERGCSDPSSGDMRGTSTDPSLETSTIVSQHQPTTLRLNDRLTKFSGEDIEDEGAFPRWLRKLDKGLSCTSGARVRSWYNLSCY